MEFTDAVQLALGGIAQGCGYALIAIGFVFIYRATEIVNFAHGELMMLGAFVIFTFAQIFGFNFWLSVIMGIAVLGLFGYMLDIVVMRRVIGEPQASIFTLTVAMSFMFQAIAGMIWGFETLSLNTPFQKNIVMGAFTFGVDQFVIIAGTIILCGILYLFFNNTRIGIAIQAASQNQLAAYYVRIPVRRLIALVWAIAAMVAAFAGLMIAPATQLSTTMGIFGLKAFAGAVIGGFGSIPGALLGCLLIGIAEPFLDWGFPALKGTYAYLIMFLVLFIRPRGLIPQTFTKKV